MRKFRRLNRFRERGVAAVEAAIIFPILALVLAGPTIYLARYMWHYEVAQKAAHDAALFLANASNAEMQTLGASGYEVGAASLARNIALEEISELSPGETVVPPGVLCEYQINKNQTAWNTCNGILVPINVQVTVAFTYTDPFFEGGQLIWIPVQLRYVGN
jgi:Flp pilus assembly protein TadG